MAFPVTRLRRLRMSEVLRKMVRETRLSPEQFIYPMFVHPGEGLKREIASMPGNYQWSIDTLIEEVRSVKALGIGGIILFGIPERKDELATSAYDDRGIIQEAVRALKREVRGILVVTDVCLCEYTSHGHCGVVERGRVKNDPTLELLAKTAVSHAEAGADVVAPSDMMDGRVAAIREALDESGLEETPILAYAAKYASSFYGPFREAAESAPQFGDRRAYQMDPANSDEALREVALDLDEGADMVMVKPALAYLDILWRVKAEFGVPVAAYSVSGEFAMLKAAARLGWLDEERTMMEMLTAIRRAGADLIVTYFAREAARLLRQQER